MTDISSLQKFLTEQPDKASIVKIDRQSEAKEAHDLAVKTNSAEIKRRRNIKES
jgi:hypothetical protein